MNWIAVTEELPKQGEEVIGWDCFYSKFHVCENFSEKVTPTMGNDDVFITHWCRVVSPDDREVNTVFRILMEKEK